MNCAGLYSAIESRGETIEGIGGTPAIELKHDALQLAGITAAPLGIRQRTRLPPVRSAREHARGGLGNTFVNGGNLRFGVSREQGAGRSCRTPIYRVGGLSRPTARLGRSQTGRRWCPRRP